MTKEELKEAISATITENGEKGITGQALANLLNEIVDAAGEGGGGGGDVLCLDLKFDMETFEPILTPSDENLQLRQTLIEGLTNNKHYTVFVMVAINPIIGSGGVWQVESRVAKYSYINVTESGLDELKLAVEVDNGGTITTTQIVINSDGSLNMTEL
jgi:hypothetical protein